MGRKCSTCNLCFSPFRRLGKRLHKKRNQGRPPLINGGEGGLRTKNGRRRPLHLLPGIELFMESRVRSGSAYAFPSSPPPYQQTSDVPRPLCQGLPAAAGVRRIAMQAPRHDVASPGAAQGSGAWPTGRHYVWASQVAIKRAAMCMGFRRPPTTGIARGGLG